MVDYILKTYSNEGDTVLDISCYNGLTGICAKLLNRNYIGVDIQHISRRGVRQLHRSILQGGGGGDIGYLRARLQQFYDASPEHVSAFETITGYNTNTPTRMRANKRQYRLRHVDHFVRVMCKNQSNKPLRELYLSYRRELKDYTKELFDPYCRSNKIRFRMGPTRMMVTTLAQLNYVRWLIKNRVIPTVLAHLPSIRADLGIKSPMKIPGNSSHSVAPPLLTSDQTHVQRDTRPVPEDRPRSHAPRTPSRSKQGRPARIGHRSRKVHNHAVRRRLSADQ